ncbi:MAG: hypothetical protein FJY07_09775 [Bacteroidetes bacterium]|nr:hypothetical protein [Bacteroidota bacterium]
MKKLIYFSLSLAMVVLTAGFTMAQNNADSTTKTYSGISDSSGSIIHGKNFIDENNNKICDRFESVNSRGKKVNYSDADKNGVCDNFKASQCCGNGKGNGFRSKIGQGRGCCCHSGCCHGNGNKHRHGWKR